MTANQAFPKGRKLCAALLVGTVLGGLAMPARAQTRPPPDSAPAGATQPATTEPAAVQPAAVPEPTRTIRSLAVSGNQRLEPETVLSYTALRAGEPYDQERLDQALRDLYATELFADVTIGGVGSWRSAWAGAAGAAGAGAGAIWP